MSLETTISEIETLKANLDFEGISTQRGFYCVMQVKP